MGFFKKIKDTTEKGLDLSKKGIELSKQGIDKVDEIKETHKQNEDKAIKNYLDSDEEILYSISQKRTSGGGVRPIKIIVTNKQIITKSPYLLKSITNSYRWEEISRLEYRPSVMSYTLVISPHGVDAVEIEGLPKKEVDEILSLSNKFIQPLKKDSETTSNDQKNEDPLSVLKIRYVKGEITKEEFEEMKKVLE